MAESLFDIAFSGQLMPGADPMQVKTNLATLFKTDAARIEALFCARTVIKKRVDEHTARQYQAALAKAGAQVEMVRIGPAAVPPAAPTVMTMAEPGVLLVEPVMVPVPEFDFRGITLAEVGANLVEPNVPESPQFDLSGLQLAPPGTVLDDQPPPPPASIDTSALSLAKQ